MVLMISADDSDRPPVKKDGGKNFARTPALRLCRDFPNRLGYVG